MCHIILLEYCFLTLHLSHKSSQAPPKGPTQAEPRIPDKSLLTIPQCGPRNSQLSEPLLYTLLWHWPPLSPLLIPSLLFTVQSLCHETSSSHFNPQWFCLLFTMPTWLVCDSLKHLGTDITQIYLMRLPLLALRTDPLATRQQALYKYRWCSTSLWSSTVSLH